MQGRYTNGQTRNLGQFLLSSFPNTNGLQPLGNNQFAEFAPSKQREYMEWISDAKADETCERRLKDAI